MQVKEPFPQVQIQSRAGGPNLTQKMSTWLFSVRMKFKLAGSIHQSEEEENEEQACEAEEVQLALD